MKPHPYQSTAISEIIDKFKLHQKVCLQLSTGGGKTVIFAFFIQWYLKTFPHNVLILAHRTELITQAETTLSEIGIGSEPVYSKTRRLKHHSRTYISMVETASNRLATNPYFFPKIGLVIVDECHIGVFDKVFTKFTSAKVLGCTATPCVLKRITFWKCKYCRNNYAEPTICCNEDAEEWSKPFTLSQIYDDIVVGPPIQQLFEYGSIVPEISFIKHYTDDTQLKTDSDGEFVPETVEKQYGSENAAFNVLLNYKELCDGKKTLIFNSSTKSNPLLFEKFKESGMGDRVRLYDSVNRELSGSRAELLEWFAKTPNAVLINTGVFTTGFDSKEVEAIIINRPTASLSLFLQIVGRGGRASNSIYKPNFILVDGGGNIDRFGEWSSDRDWKSIFFNGIGGERAKRLNAIDIHSCPECGALYPKSEPECPECGFCIPQSEPRTRNVQESDQVLQPIRPIPPPNGEQIYKYTVKQGEDINFAFKIMVNQLVDMFRYYRITYTQYESALKSGELDKKTARLIQKCYFVLLSKKDIQTPGKRTLAELLKRTKQQLQKYYETRGKLHSTAVRGGLHQQILPEASYAEIADL
jgi:superfamily II DNA or RNA helicase